MAIAVMLNLSCERESWQTADDLVGSGEPVQIRLAYEIPSSDVVVTTRTLSGLEEHDVKDLYVLVFRQPASSEGVLKNWERVNKDAPSSSYFSTEDLEDAKKYNPTGTWNSVIDDGTANSTYGAVVVDAISGYCLIYAIANVEYGEAVDLHGKLDAIQNASDLYDLTTELNAQSLLARDGRNLLMSGVFLDNDDRGDYDANYTPLTAGLVNVTPLGNTNLVDLTSKGIIKLRRLSSHISFKIEVKPEMFTEFKPVSWQVVHIPTKSYMLDRGDISPKTFYENNEQIYPYQNSEIQTSMINAEGKFQFDFYMFENRKDARETTDYWYVENYGATINDTKQPGSETDCLMLEKFDHVPNVDSEELFKYTKRELERKVHPNYDGSINETTGTLFWDDATDNTQKQFVYVDPYATYVVIKGRLMLKDNVSLMNYATGTPQTVSGAYADVTYVVHLGYAMEMNIRDRMETYPGPDDEEITAGDSEAVKEAKRTRAAAKAAYKLTDFNSLRNTNYTYNITIESINSIYTNVVAENDIMGGYKLMSGASGFIGLVSEKVYHVDSHYNAFVISLNKDQLNNFNYEISTPFTPSIKPDVANLESQNPDFTWIKVRFNGLTVPRNEGYDFFANTDGSWYGNSDPNKVQTFKIEGNNTYNSADNLMNLQRMKAFIDANRISWGGADYANGKDYTAYFSVYLDEYFYESPPSGLNWGSNPNLYWHEFVNKPARYVSFSNSTQPRKYTTDGESSKLEPSMMIVQQSIQTHYSNSSANGLGMEHDNETPNPRWYVVDATNDGPIPNNPSPAFSITNGWANTWRYVQGVLWSKYVANTADNTHHNLEMVASGSGRQALKPKDASGESNGNTDNPYKASAIRLCMNRNRDENGNGVIDKDEMKWYLPTALQVNDISLCHFSYYDPLLDFNSLYGNPTYTRDDTWGNQYIILPEMKDLDMKGYNSNNANRYSNHTYVTSDYKKVGTQEVNNTKVYDVSSYTSRPGQLRCVRNLGIDVDAQETTSPTAIFYFDKNTRTFDLSRLESRSLRLGKAERTELKASTHISEANRPYKYFKVAKDTVMMKKNSYNWGNAVNLHNALTTERNRCRTYKDPDESDDKIGTWRAPNLSELVLMMSYDDSKPSGDPPLLPVYGDRVFVCNTVWGFTPSATVWGRAFTTKKNGSVWSTTLTDAKYSNSHWQETLLQTAYHAVIRCVKDVD